MAANESILVAVDLDAAPPPKFDYGSSTAELSASAQVNIGGQDFQILQVTNQGKRLVVEVPPGLPVGPKDLQVKFADGRQAASASGFEVTPALDIIGLSIDPITTQVRLRPFAIRIRVMGPDAELFRGRVKLSTNRGSISPTVSGPFTRGGLLTQEVVVDDTGGVNVTITAEDYAGHSATSNDFRLNPN
jgi:hypothetical protein